MIYRSNIVIPMTCPLTFVDARSPQTVYPERYLQRFGSTDPLHIQFLASNDLADTFYLKCYSAQYDIPLASATFTKSTLLAGSYYYWDAYLSFTTILAAIQALGIHYLNTVVYFRIETTDLYMDSLPVFIGSHHETVGLLYHNTSNDFETVFGTWSMTNSFLLRVQGGFARGYFKMGGDYETFLNQKNEPKVVYAMPKSNYILTLGDNFGLSDTMVEKLNAILHLDTIMIDGIQYCRMGEVSQTLNDFGLWNLKVEMTPATNRMTQNMEGDIWIVTQDGTPITDEDVNILTISPAIA